MYFILSVVVASSAYNQYNCNGNRLLHSTKSNIIKVVELLTKCIVKVLNND